jgi:hypothetical protein
MKGENVRIKVFGRSGCARTRAALLRLSRFVRGKQWPEEVELRFFDLETAEGLAEAAFHQLEGDLPAVLVEAKFPGPVISGEPPFRDRKSAQGESPHSILSPSWN